jgi:hypothetical protein
LLSAEARVIGLRVTRAAPRIFELLLTVKAAIVVFLVAFDDVNVCEWHLLLEGVGAVVLRLRRLLPTLLI